MEESLFEKIKSVLEEIDVCYPYMECCEGEFFANGIELCYSEVGEVYSQEIREEVYTKGDCTFINYDSGCGETITKVLLTKNQLSEGKFYEKYEGSM